MTNLLAKLKNLVAEQRAADEASRDRLEQIRLTIVSLRVETDMKLPDVEQEIDRYWDRATISRKTSDDVAARKAELAAQSAPEGPSGS